MALHGSQPNFRQNVHQSSKAASGSGITRNGVQKSISSDSRQFNYNNSKQSPQNTFSGIANTSGSNGHSNSISGAFHLPPTSGEKQTLQSNMNKNGSNQVYESSTLPTIPQTGESHKHSSYNSKRPSKSINNNYSNGNGPSSSSNNNRASLARQSHQVHAS